MDSQVNPLRIAYHTLRIADPTISLAFYQTKLGMTLHARAESTVDAVRIQHYFLGFVRPGTEGNTNSSDLLHLPATLIELTHWPDQTTAENSPSAVENAGYWKIGITLADVDLAREQLLDAGLAVSEAQQFHDVGYLCHLNDPDGYSIELLQHRFAHNHQPSAPLLNVALRGVPTFGQISLRVKDPENSLDFYVRGLGMRLLSRQIIEPHRFTLYFLGCTEEQPPYADVDDVRNREWLWQRPYTVLELQHVWGTELGQFHYRVTPDTGFERISLIADDADAVVAGLIAVGPCVSHTKSFDPILSANTITVRDPDGYAVRIIKPT